MVTKKEYDNAQKVISDYAVQVNKTLVKSLLCVCCKTKEVKPLEGMSLSEGHVKATEQEKGCWSDGSVGRINFGYGSRFDTDSFYVAICDDCIEQLKKEGLAVDFKKLRKEEGNLGL